MIQFTINRHLLKHDCHWMKHNYQSYNTGHLFISHQSCISDRGIYCIIDKHKTIEEIPADALVFIYQKVEYEIIMTEKINKTHVFYFKKMPFKRLDVLSQIQNKKEVNQTINDILKLTITKGQIEFQSMSINAIEVLF
jgi:hypothetical protein